MDKTNEKKKYLAAEVGMDAKNLPHAFHVEGYIARPPFFKEAQDDKKAFLGTAIGINMAPEKMMALADGSYSADANYGEDSGFVALRVFGKTAEEFSKVCKTGVKVAVSGTLSWNEFTKKDGAPGRELTIGVNNLVVMGGKNVEPETPDHIGVAARPYVGKDGVQRVLNYAELLAGKVVGCRGLQQSGNGKSYLAFGLLTKVPAEKVYDLSVGTYNKDKEYNTKKCIVNVTVFDKAAEALSKVIRDKAMVVCSGPVSEREYNGDISYQMRPRVCSVMKFAPVDNTAPAATAAPASAAPTATPTAESAAADYAGFAPLVEDDDDEELPF